MNKNGILNDFYPTCKENNFNMKLVSNISVVQHPTGKGENLSLIGQMEAVSDLSTRQYRGDNLGFLWSRETN